MSFDPTPYLIELKKKSYLPVPARVAWFRDEYPIGSGWAVLTERTAGGYEAGFATYRATVIDPEGRPIATATKTEDKAGFADYEEKAETGSVGRALGLCGFGTLFALELDEGTDRIADSPIQRATVTEKAPPAAQPSVETPVRKNRSQIEDKYAEWLEKAARLGAVRKYPQEFQVFRTFDPSGAMPDRLKQMCQGLKDFVVNLEAERVTDAALPEDHDPFEKDE